MADINDVGQFLPMRNAQRSIRRVSDQNFESFIINNVYIQCQVGFGNVMKQEVSIIQKRYQQEQNHCFGAKGHYLVAFCKELFFQELTFLSSFDGNGDLAASYHGTAHFKFEYNAFKNKNIFPHKYICSRTID